MPSQPKRNGKSWGPRSCFGGGDFGRLKGPLHVRWHHPKRTSSRSELLLEHRRQQAGGVGEPTQPQDLRHSWRVAAAPENCCFVHLFIDENGRLCTKARFLCRFHFASAPCFVPISVDPETKLLCSDWPSRPNLGAITKQI